MLSQLIQGPTRPWLAAIPTLVCLVFGGCGGGGNGGGAPAGPTNFVITQVEPTQDRLFEPSNGIDLSMRAVVRGEVQPLNGPGEAFLAVLLEQLLPDGTVDRRTIAGAEELRRQAVEGGAAYSRTENIGFGSGRYRIVIQVRMPDGDVLAEATSAGTLIVDQPPQITVERPSRDVTLGRGGLTRGRITHIDLDRLGVETRVFADADGNAGSTADRFEIAGPLALPSGTPSETIDPPLDFDGLPEGSYFVQGMVSDSVYEPILATAPGRVSIANVAWARRDGGSGTDCGNGSCFPEFERPIDVATLPGDRCVVFSAFLGDSVLGEGQPNQWTAPEFFRSATLSAGLLTFYDSEGFFERAITLSGTTRTDQLVFPTAVTTFESGAILITGNFDNTLVINSSGTILGSGNGNRTGFIARMDQFGNTRWAHALNTSQQSTNVADAAAVESDGSCLYVGSDGDRALIGRRDVAGNRAWQFESRSASGHSATARTVAAYADGSSVVAGKFSGTLQLPGRTLTSFGGSDGYVMWLSDFGSIERLAHFGGSLDDSVSEIEIAPDGSVYLTGLFQGTARFAVGTGGTEVTVTSAGREDIFIAHWDPSGTFDWVRTAGGISLDQGIALTSLADSSCVVAGRFFSPDVVFGSGEPNETTLTASPGGEAYFARYMSSGDLRFASSAGGAERDIATGLATLSDSSFLVTGYFQAPMVLGRGDPRETTLSNRGGPLDADLFLARVNGDGKF